MVSYNLHRTGEYNPLYTFIYPKQPQGGGFRFVTFLGWKTLLQPTSTSRLAPDVKDI